MLYYTLLRTADGSRSTLGGYMVMSPAVVIEGPDVLQLAFCNVMATNNFRRTFFLQIYYSVTLHSVTMFCDGV